MRMPVYKILHSRISQCHHYAVIFLVHTVHVFPSDLYALYVTPSLWLFFCIIILSPPSSFFGTDASNLTVNCWPYIPSSQSSFKTQASAIIPSALFNVCINVCVRVFSIERLGLCPYISYRTNLQNSLIYHRFLWTSASSFQAHSYTDKHHWRKPRILSSKTQEAT